MVLSRLLLWLLPREARRAYARGAGLSQAVRPPWLSPRPRAWEGVLEAHRLWVETGGKRGFRADLTGQDLRGKELRGAMLRTAILAGANLEGVQGGGAVLFSADLRNACLRGADFREGLFLGAELRGAASRQASDTFRQ